MYYPQRLMCVNNCSSPGPLLFKLYRTDFCVGVKSWIVGSETLSTSSRELSDISDSSVLYTLDTMYNLIKIAQALIIII